MSPGTKVVCIDDSVLLGKEEFKKYAFPNWIQQGNIYTIRAILDNQGIVPGILLRELVNPEIYIRLLDAYQEPAFRTNRFRELTYQELEELAREEADNLDLVNLEEYVY